MRKLYILIFALSLFTGTAFGQMVKGHVYDAKTHEPLPGVNITYKKINGGYERNHIGCRRSL